MLRRSALVELEAVRALGPLSGFFVKIERPTYSLRIALADVLTACRQGSISIAERHLISVVSFCEEFANSRGSDRLPLAEIGAVHLYSFDFETQIPGCRGNLYSILNEYLRDENRQLLLPFKAFLVLFLYGVYDCPPVGNCVVFRGMKRRVNIVDYTPGNVLTWYQFSSCSLDLGVQQQFLGEDGDRTLFHVELKYGRARLISDYSSFPEEREALLPPNTRVLVKGIWDAGNGLITVHLEEVAPLDFILDFSTSPKEVGIQEL